MNMNTLGVKSLASIYREENDFDRRHWLMIGAFKGIVHPKKEKILALFMQSHVVWKPICSNFFVEPPFFIKCQKWQYL